MAQPRRDAGLRAEKGPKREGRVGAAAVALFRRVVPKNFGVDLEPRAAAPAFITWPSMIVCAGRWANPQRTICSFLRASLSCTTLIELAPMSTPTRFLPSAIVVFARVRRTGGWACLTSVAPGKVRRQKRRRARGAQLEYARG